MNPKILSAVVGIIGSLLITVIQAHIEETGSVDEGSK